MLLSSHRYLGPMPRSWSKTALWSLCALLFFLRTTQTAKHALTWDVFGYYLYLPATFIHDDPGLKDRAWLDEVMAKYDPSATLYQLAMRPDPLPRFARDKMPPPPGRRGGQ